MDNVLIEHVPCLTSLARVQLKLRILNVFTILFRHSSTLSVAFLRILVQSATPYQGLGLITMRSRAQQMSSVIVPYGHSERLLLDVDSNDSSLASRIISR